MAIATEPRQQDQDERYKIVSGSNSLDMARTVNKYLSEGWGLAGGLQVSQGKWGLKFHQAMTRPDTTIEHRDGVSVTGFGDKMSTTLPYEELMARAGQWP